MCRETSEVLMTPEENGNTCQQERVEHGANPVRLTPEQWACIAEFIDGLGNLVNDLLPADSPYKSQVRRFCEYAAVAALYVSEYAAEECAFCVMQTKEDKNDTYD